MSKNISQKVYEDFFQGDSTSLYNYIKDKNPKLSFDYDEIMHSSHHKAFTIAKVTKLDLLKDIQEALAKAKLDGINFEQWKKDIKPILAKKGWLGDIEVTNDKTGEIKKIYVGSKRLKTIYDTNMSVANAQARYDTQMSSDAEFFYYSAVMDNLTRPSHAKHHGLILSKNDPFWDTNYPPNGYNCRCQVRAYTKDELEKRGLEVSKKAVQDIASKPWAYNVGQTNNINKIYQDKIDKLPISTLKTKAQNEFNNTLTTIKENKKLYKEIKDLFIIKEAKKITLCKSDIFGVEKKVLLSSDTVQGHLDRKEITAFDYALIPQMLQGEKRVFQQKTNVVVILKKLGKNYRLTLKNVLSSDEIFATSLLFVKDLEKEYKKLSKYKEK